MDDELFYDDWTTEYGASATSQPAQSSGSSFDWGGFSQGLGSTVQGLANIYGQTWAQTQLMQQSQQGQRYIEGQRLASMNMATGGISPLLLILGAGLVFMFAIKN